jgi:hypothetical protein
MDFARRCFLDRLSRRPCTPSIFVSLARVFVVVVWGKLQIRLGGCLWPRRLSLLGKGIVDCSRSKLEVVLVVRTERSAYVRLVMGLRPS